MSTITPNGSIIFYEDVEPDMFFYNVTERTNYYASKKRTIIPDRDYSYINHMDGAIRVEMEYAETAGLWRCNYLSFTSSGESWSNSERRYFCKISDYRRLNNGTVEIYYGIDWLQTDMFEYRISYAQVDRETTPVGTFVNDDANTLYTSEPLSVAEPIKYTMANNFTFSDGKFSATMERGDSAFLRYGGNNIQDLYRVVLVAIENEYGIDYNPNITDSNNLVQAGHFDLENIVTDYTSGSGSSQRNYKMGGVSLSPYTGSYGTYWGQYISPANIPQPYYVCIKKVDQNGLNDLQNIINNYASRDMLSSIIGVYYLPQFMIVPRYASYSGGSLTSLDIGNDVTITTPYSMSDILSSKLNVAPYSYLRVITQDGITKFFDIDKFDDPSEIQFKLTGNFASGVPVGSLIPVNYNGLLYNFNERITLPVFPQLAYTIDGSIVYQSAVNQSLIQANGSQRQKAINRATYDQSMEAANLYQYGMIGNALKDNGSMDERIRNNAPFSLKDVGDTLTGGASQLGEWSRDFKAGSTEMLRAHAELMRQQGIMSNSINSAVSNISRGRANGANWDSPLFKSDLLADNAQMQDFYSPASGDFSPLICGYDGIRFDFVTLREGLRKQYNKFFDMFGYTNGSIRRPVLSHNNGTTSHGDNKATSCFNNDPFNNEYKQGYVRCSSINVFGVSDTSADYIKARFLTGIVWHREV